MDTRWSLRASRSHSTSSNDLLSLGPARAAGVAGAAGWLRMKEEGSSGFFALKNPAMPSCDMYALIRQRKLVQEGSVDLICTGLTNRSGHVGAESNGAHANSECDHKQQAISGLIRIHSSFGTSVRARMELWNRVVRADFRCHRQMFRATAVAETISFWSQSQPQPWLRTFDLWQRTLLEFRLGSE